MKKTIIHTDQESQAASRREDVSTAVELKSLREMFKEAFDLYCSKFTTAIGIMGIPVALAVILSEFGRASVSFSILHQASWPSVVKFLLWLALLFFNVVSIAALLLSVKNETGIKKSYLQSLEIASPFALVVLLGLLMITGGLMLLVVPGLIFFTWFSLALYVSIWEGKRGIEALQRSKQLVGGLFWKVFLRLGAISFAALIIGIALGVFGKILGDAHGIIGGLLHVFLVPLVVFFGLILFQNLVDAQRHVAKQGSEMMGKIPCYIAAIAGAPIIGAVAVLQILFLFTGDVPLPDDSDVRLQAITVPEGQNAFAVFREAKDKIYWPQDEINKSGIDKDLSEKILQSNEQSLDAFDRGVSMPVFQIPELQDPQNYRPDIATPSITFLRNLAKVNSLKATSLFEQGNQKEAFVHAMKTIKMGQMLEDGQNGTSGYLTGLVIKEIGLETMRSFIGRSMLSPSELLVHERELNNYRGGTFGLRNVLGGEYMTAVNAKEEIGKAFLNDMFPLSGDTLAYAERSGYSKWLEPFALKSFYYYKPNKTTALFLEAFRGMFKNGSAASYSQVAHAERTVAPWYGLLFTENRYGKTRASIPGVSLDGIFSKKFEELFSVESTQVLLALKAYERDHGSLPDTLEDLVPQYIPEAVQDPFDGGVMKYSGEKKILYSTGKDLVDNAGDISESDWKQGADYGFAVGF